MAVLRIGGLFEKNTWTAVFGEIVNLQKQVETGVLEGLKDFRQQRVLGQKRIMNVEEVTGAVEVSFNYTKDLIGNLAGILREIAFARISDTRDADDVTGKICRRRLTADHQQCGIILKGFYLMAQNGCNAAWSEMIM